MPTFGYDYFGQSSILSLMILEFSIANYRSFNTLQTFSFRATGLTSDVDKANIIEVDDKTRLLKIAGIYGPNASGKSNLVKGILFLQKMITNSLESDKISFEGYEPFRLSAESKKDAGYFQIVLLLDNKKYRYGFTLNPNATIQNEWLFGPAQVNETYYFKRTGSEVHVNEEYFEEGINLPLDKLRKEVLFLTFCSSYNGIISELIKGFISEKIFIDNGRSPLPFSSRHRESTNALVENGNKEIVLDWLRTAGLAYSDISLEPLEIAKTLILNRVKLIKHIFNGDEVVGQAIMDLDTDESDGTKKYYSYIGQLFNLFKRGGVFVADEIDSNFHSSLLHKIIGLFQHPTLNIHNAQLLFTSHDTSLMNPSCMRRDQFYFTEKSTHEETVLYSLADLKGIRNNADFARQYLSGVYGALPQLGNYLADRDAESDQQ